jgi:predicted TIM-barrel fold metal-dependent hydrolase
MSANGGYGPTWVCAGIVGHADLRLGARVDEVLEAHLRAGGGRFRGIRHSAARDAAIPRPANAPDPGLYADAHFRAGFARLAPFGLSFDAWLYHPQIDELTALARAFPDTPIVLDHVGGPIGIGASAGRRDAQFARWTTSIRDLATCPNVFAKLGGLGMPFTNLGLHEGPAPPSSERLAAAARPYFETCIAAFGPERCRFESNFPVDKESFSYAVYWNACKRPTQGASTAERAALFSRSAAQFYRLALPEGAAAAAPA